jgi:hypothetical protein
MSIIPGPNNELMTASVAPSYGSTANVAQATASSVYVSSSYSFPYPVISASITTTGNPVFIACSGDANPISIGGLGTIQLYRDSTAIGTRVQYEGSAANENNPYCLTCIDSQPAGTYTYYLKSVSQSGHTQFGEVSGPSLSMAELR